ncbi:hypothetical protein [Actinoallomurus liliacearum]|uniref:hypothetical protein n=1 Tax=Actinoallomurus liliacearum TaxID=1080073 RepID=UPI0031EEA907
METEARHWRQKSTFDGIETKQRDEGCYGQRVRDLFRGRWRAAAVCADHSEKMRLLVALCRELARLGLPSVMSDARPALSVSGGPADPKVWISVSPCGEFYEWFPDPGDRFPATSPECAAERIAGRLRTHPG